MLVAPLLLEKADKSFLKGLDAPHLDQSARGVRRQHLARVHQRDPVAAGRLIHEMGRDKDRHAMIAR